MIPTTYCLFTSPDPTVKTRIGVLGSHPETKNIRGRFNAFAKIYCGLWGWRVFTKDHTGNVILDTDKEDWIHPEVKRVRKSKEPVLLVGILKSPQGKAELEKRMKGKNHDKDYPG